MWYLDDGLLIGEPEKISTTFQFLVTEFRKIGLEVNAKKCSLWGPGSHACIGLQDVEVLPWSHDRGQWCLEHQSIIQGRTTSPKASGINTQTN